MKKDSGGRTKTGVRKLGDREEPDFAKDAAMTAAGVGETTAAPAKVHVFSPEAFELIKDNYLGSRARFNPDSWRARAQFLRKEKGDPTYSLTVEDIQELIFLEELPEGQVDDVDGQPLVNGVDNVVALIVIPFLDKSRNPNPNAGDLLTNQDGTPKERGMSLTYRKDGQGFQPLEVISFRESNRRLAEEVARNRKIYLTSYRSASARAAVINGNEGRNNSYKERKGIGVTRDRTGDKGDRTSPFPSTRRGHAKFDR